MIFVEYKSTDCSDMILNLLRLDLHRRSLSQLKTLESGFTPLQMSWVSSCDPLPALALRHHVGHFYQLFLWQPHSPPAPHPTCRLRRRGSFQT